MLLGLDPQDPKGVLFCIDYLAIRAQQYQFLQVGCLLNHTNEVCLHDLWAVWVLHVFAIFFA